MTRVNAWVRVGKYRASTLSKVAKTATGVFMVTGADSA
jgi:hypothetical protein